MVKKKRKKKGFKISDLVESKEDVQLFWILFVIVVIVVAFLVVWFYMQSLKTFNYAGIQWRDKDDFCLREYYHGRFPIVFDGVVKNYYNFCTRTDPRKNDIPINTKIYLSPKSIVISLEPEAGNCDKATIGQIELGKFIGAFGVSKVISAVNDQRVASAMGVPYVTCSSASAEQTVIIVQKSESPLIEKEIGNDNCYVVNVGECENVKTMERLIVGIIAQLNNVEL